MKNKTFWLSLLITLALGSLFYFKKNLSSSPAATPWLTVSSSPEIKPIASSSLVATGQPKPSPSPKTVCSVSGAIKFTKPDLSENLGAKIKYTGIDNPARQIQWTVSPANDLKVGPNLVAQLTIPDGSSMVIVTLPDHPLSKSYSLQAAITDGHQLTLAKCSGQISVNLEY